MQILNAHGRRSYQSKPKRNYAHKMISFSVSTKSVLATILLALAGPQLAAIAVAMGWLGRFSPKARRRAAQFHRLEGYAALLVILTIAYDCIFVIRPNLPVIPTRAQVHSLLGGLVLSLIFAKISIARLASRFDWLPKLGITLFVAIIAIWISSAAWYFFWY